MICGLGMRFEDVLSLICFLVTLEVRKMTYATQTQRETSTLASIEQKACIFI